MMGELSLDGSIRSVRGALAAALACRSAGRRGLILPAANAPEAAVIEGVEVVPVASLGEAIQYLKGRWDPPGVDPISSDATEADEDLSEVRGQGHARKAMEIAAAGGHNLVFVGPPGSGKTMLARRLPGILPAMSLEEAIEVTGIYSVAGLLPERSALITRRPFRSPHPHVSVAGLVGGGSRSARPGEITLAHRGVLFLDELTLFRRDVLDALRAPMEEGVVRLARSGGVIGFPADFFIAAAMNPCYCGYANDSHRSCSCTDQQLTAYRSRLTGPFMDRFDLQVEMHRPNRRELLEEPPGEPSAAVRERVEKARLIQTERYGCAHKTNGNVRGRDLRTTELSPDARETLGAAVDLMFLSGRAATRVLRVARTIADLEGGGPIAESHIADALNLRFLEEKDQR